MRDKAYIVATTKPWNIRSYKQVISHYPGKWFIVTKPDELTADLIKTIKPRFIFFPHWSSVVPNDILDLTECVCFHETDLPYGRGGSPIQNLITLGHSETMICALRMVEELDAGPIYLKRRLSLVGLAEEIFIRASKIYAEMILDIITNEPVPIKQEGKATVFKRRSAEESEISVNAKTLQEVFDHIRMLDGSGYPRAVIKHGVFKFEISRPTLRTDSVEASVRITRLEGVK